MGYHSLTSTYMSLFTQIKPPAHFERPSTVTTHILLLQKKLSHQIQDSTLPRHFASILCQVSLYVGQNNPNSFTTCKDYLNTLTEPNLQSNFINALYHTVSQTCIYITCPTYCAAKLLKCFICEFHIKTVTHWCSKKSFLLMNNFKVLYQHYRNLYTYMQDTISIITGSKEINYYS